MNDSTPNPTDHLPENLIAAYAIGKCSPAVQAEIDEHCFTCESCRTRLSILLRLSSTDESELERCELERLFPLGKETIAQARQPVGAPETSALTATSNFSPGLAIIADKNTSPIPRIASKSRSNTRRSLQVSAVSLLLIACVGAGYYWYVNTHSPVQNSILAMQRSYPSRRPLEARMSGDLEYKPYERTRGNLDSSDINRDQLNYALAELTRLVATNPTPQVRHALGRLYLILGEFDKAESEMLKAMEALKNDAKLHTDLAALYYERSNYSDSSASAGLKQAVEHYRLAIEIDPKFAEAWFNRALCNEKLFLFSKAKEDWEQYLKLDSDSKWADEARERLRKLDERANQPTPVKENTAALFEKAITSKDDEALSLLVDKNVVAAIHFSSNNLFEQYVNADLAGMTGQSEQSLANLKKMGDLIAKHKGDRFIIDLADLAARASPQIKNRMLSVLLKLRQADEEYSRSSHDAAFNSYKSAYIAAKSIGDELHSEIAASYLVRYSNLRANSSSLISLGNNLVTQIERNKHRYLQAQIHYALANGYLASQQGSQALKNSLRAVEIARQIGDKDTAINGLIFAGAAYTRSGNYNLGTIKIFEIFSLIKDYPISKLRTFQIQEALWEPLFRSGDYHLALEFQEEALRTASALRYKPAIAGATGRMGLNLWKLNQNNNAENYLKTAISECDLISDKTLRQLLQTELYTALGDIELSLGKTGESLANFDLALKSIKASNNNIHLSAIYQGMASAYLAQNKVPEAEQELRRSILMLEKGRQHITDVSGKSVFIARSQNAYLAMVDLQYYYKHDNAMAFDYAETARNRSVFDVLTNHALPTTLDGRLVLSLSQTSRPLKLKEVQRSLQKNTQLISYAVSSKGLIIWCVTPSSVFSATIAISPDKLKQSISSYLTKLRNKQDIEMVNLQAAELYQTLISPLAQHLNSNQTLHIIQDGFLAELPFSSLYNQSTKRYLVEDYPIITNHSASEVAQTNALTATKAADNIESVIGISNPRFSYRRFTGLPALPASEEEVGRIITLYDRSLFFSQDKALESEVVKQIPKYDIVHIASHTLSNDENPLTTSILLAEEQQKSLSGQRWKGGVYDGTLQASEIYHLNLSRTKLVVLSSCRSGAGDYSKGEAIGALAQAFIAARVPSVVASLWNIEDESSAELMYYFHNIYRKNMLGVAESLRRAQQSFINGVNKKKGHPYYWAAFELLGSDTK